MFHDKKKQRIIAGVIAGICLVVKKIKEKKDAGENEEECYVSCSCCEEQA